MSDIAQDLGGVVLLPCPMCGGEAHLERQGHVACMTGWPCAHTAYFNSGTPSEQNAAAITAWNTRPAMLRDAGDGSFKDPSKPSWSDAPPWANFLARNEHGPWYWYEKRPSRERGLFFPQGGSSSMFAGSQYIIAQEIEVRPLPQPPAMHAPGGAGGG